MVDQNGPVCYTNEIVNKQELELFITLEDFVGAVQELDRVSDAYYLFEDRCSEALRGEIYSFADADATEPFRSAMYNLGFTSY